MTSIQIHGGIGSYLAAFALRARTEKGLGYVNGG